MCARGYPRPEEEYSYWLSGPVARLRGGRKGKRTDKDGGGVLADDGGASAAAAVRALDGVDVVGLTRDLDAFAFLAARALGLDKPPSCIVTKNTAGNGGSTVKSPDAVAPRARRLRGLDWHGIRGNISQDVLDFISNRHPNDNLVYAAVEDRYARDFDGLDEEARLQLDLFRSRCSDDDAGRRRGPTSRPRAPSL